MPSLIPSYIARLRTHSQSTATSSSSHTESHSNSTAGPSTPGSELARLATDPLVGQPDRRIEQTLKLRIGRKIHPDLTELLDENIPSERPTEQLAPRPSRGNSRPTEQPTRLKSDDLPQSTAEPHEEPESIAIVTPSSSKSSFISRILSAPLLSGIMSTPHHDEASDPESGTGTAHWSTFGRRRPLAPETGEFGSLDPNKSDSKSSTRSKSLQRGQSNATSASLTPTTTRPPSVHAGTPSRTQTAETAPSQSTSPAGTVSSSSKSHSGHSHSVRSRHLPLTHPETISDVEPTIQQSPGTPPSTAFHATPRTSTLMASSPLIARPTLDDSPHTFGRGTPERSDKTSRQYPVLSSTFIPPSTLIPSHRKSATRDPSATFPQRRRTRSRPTTGSVIGFPSVADVVFQASDHGAGKRLSAAWSATEAFRNSDNNHAESWPATISREMVRLSLTGGMSESKKEETTVNAMGALTPSRRKNATFFGSTGEDRKWFMAARKRRSTIPTAPAQSSSAIPEQSVQQPSLTVSLASGSTSAPDTTAAQGSNPGILAPYLSVTAPTPTQSVSPSGSPYGTISGSTSGARSGPNPRGQGKRKIADADDEESLRPETILMSGIRGSVSKRPSDASHAPSSFREPKRIRLSTPSRSPEHLSRSQSVSSHRSPPGSPRSRPPSSLRTLPDLRMISQTSIPLRAILSPRPPSLDRRSTYHMRDPALPPPRRQSTQWTGSARKLQEEGRRVFPLQGWAFMFGFVLFPMWWAAAIAPVGWGWRSERGTRGTQNGKNVWTEADLEARTVWEYDVASTWRRRCRFMSIIGLLVYLPLIILLAVLVPRP